MKTKRHSPRLERAIKQACEIAHANSGWWYAFRSNDLGELIFNIAYKADKYDVLNKLVKGFSKPLVSFIRGDIRHVAIKAATTATNTIILVFFILILTI